MPRRLIPVALTYDFDGTLAPGNMHEYDFIPKIGMGTDEFWDKVARLAKEHDADNILMYMHLMLKEAGVVETPVKRADFEKFGSKVELFEGVKEWFSRINIYGKESGVRVEHYIISSGLREMIEGTPISKEFRAIFASSFLYDHNEIACWPATALNYTTKTQYLFRINKGSLHIHDHTKINRWVPHADRPVPFENIVFIGDGDTDIPCFRLVKDQGGHSIGVYKPRGRRAKEKSQKLADDQRVNFIAPADYGEGKELDRIVKGIIDKIASDNYLRSLGTQK